MKTKIARLTCLLASTAMLCVSCEIGPCLPFGTLGQHGRLVFEVPYQDLAVGGTVEIDFQRTNSDPLEHVELRSSDPSVLEVVSEPTRMPVLVRGVSQGTAELEVHGTLMRTLIDKTPIRVKQIAEVSLNISSAANSDVDRDILLVGHESSAYLNVVGDCGEPLAGDLYFWASTAPEGAVGFPDAAFSSVHELSADYYGAREVSITPLLSGWTVIEMRELQSRLAGHGYFEAVEPERLTFDWWIEWDELEEPFEVWEMYFFQHRLLLHYRIEDELGRGYSAYVPADLIADDDDATIIECHEPGANCWYWPEELETATLQFKEEKTDTEVTLVVELPGSDDTEQTEPEE